MAFSGSTKPATDFQPLYATDARIDAASQIRLLELLPGRYEDGNIHCQLHPIDLKTANFEALSYTWGETTEDRSITLNSLSGFGVTNNLFAALRRLQYEDKSRVLWVDAVCINQSDFGERAQQVQLMGDVYRRAARVVIWLGDASEPASVEKSPFQPPESAITPALQHMRCPDDHEDRMMRTLDAAISVTKPQYWTRTWTIQELVLAQELLVRFGAFEISWSQLLTLRERMSSMMGASGSQLPAGTITSFLGDIPPAQGSFGHYVKLYHATDFDDGIEGLETLRSHRNTWSGLSDIASSTAQNQATDLKDRVYGYFGLWSGQRSGFLKVDYHLTAAEVFANATYADMKAEENLRVLNLVKTAAQHVNNLPSWALDFSFHDVKSYIPFYPKVLPALRSKANVAIEDSGKLLVCRARLVGYVKEVYQLPTSLYYPSANEEHLLDAVKSSLPLCDAYTNLQHSHGNVARTARTQHELGARTRLPTKAESLAFEHGVQTDPISNIFLWWLSKVRGTLPEKTEFSELYEWWRHYARYAGPANKSTQVFFITDCGFLAKGLSYVQEGDVIAFLDGLELPVVLSQVHDLYSFKGLAWVNGIIMGEISEVLDNVAAVNVTLI